MDPIQTEWPIGKSMTALKPPDLLAEQWAVQFAWRDAGQRSDLRMLVYAAALGLCDAELRGYLARPGKGWPGVRFDGDVRVFGVAVMQYLLSFLPPDNRATPDEVWAAGDAAAALCIRSSAASSSVDAVKAATDFSVPPSGSSTANSATSSSSGGWRAAGSDDSTPPKPLG